MEKREGGDTWGKLCVCVCVLWHGVWGEWGVGLGAVCSSDVKKETRGYVGKAGV